MADRRMTRRRTWLEVIFVSPSERRLRAGWRLLCQVVLQLGFTVVAGVVLILVYRGSLTGYNLSSPPSLALAELGEVASITISVYLARRLLDRRSFVGLGLRLRPRALIDLGAGLGISMLMMGLIFFASWALGWLTLNSFAWVAEPLESVGLSALAYLLVFVAVGWNEELMSRGYLLQTIASGLTPFWGLMISSAVFGALHLANPHASWVAVAGILLAGLFLGYAYLRTGQLWLSIGLHIGWNFFEGVVFGFPVSGLTTYHLARISVSGPTAWTGGAFGPEAGLMVIPAVAVGAGLVYLYTRGQSHVEVAGPGRPV